ncbi:MAG: pyridoxal phosphate-dependent class II aminotransferase [Proteobacteria bacterium]|nr:pyridoxal phosphate-dependent class II aminotransferase [Pseudomonadota bacterium]
MIIGHGGNIYDVAAHLGCQPTDIIDMSSNLNPLGPPEDLSGHLISRMDSIISLPEVNSKKITSRLADRYGIPSECVLAGNGTTQFIYSIPVALNIRKALVVGPSYADYKDACTMYQADCDYFLTRDEDGFASDMDALVAAVDGKDTVFICNPNNPTGMMWDRSDLEELCRAFPETFFVIDESYLPFAEDSYTQSAIQLRLPNVIVLNSMSKIFRIPGLRVGFLMAPVALIYRFEKYILPWSVNALAQAAVSYILENPTIIDAFLEQSRLFVKQEKQIFLEKLGNLAHLHVFPGSVYFVLARLSGTMRAQDLCDRLLVDRILIRNCGNFNGLDDRYVRFSLKDRETNLLLAHRLCSLLG